MRVTRFAPHLVVTLALTFTVGSVTGFGQSATVDNAKPAAAKAAPAKAGTFATLNGIKAVPMATPELKAVKGLHIHFTTPSANSGHPLVAPFEGWHFVNHTENNLGKGQALPIAGPGYSGLCGAALLSPALTIPGQGTSPGNGGC